jgi:hypothetical protein
MSCDVEMSDSARAHFHNQENVQDPKTGRHRGEEIAGENSLGMVANEGHPTLRRGRVRWSLVDWHVTPDSPRGDPNPEL